MEYDDVKLTGKFDFEERSILRHHNTFTRDEAPLLAFAARDDFLIVRRQLSEAALDTDTTPLETLQNLANHKIRSAYLAQELAKIGLQAENPLFTPDVVEESFGPDTFGPDFSRG